MSLEMFRGCLLFSHLKHPLVLRSQSGQQVYTRNYKDGNNLINYTID